MAVPHGWLIHASDGALYGTTFSGGSNILVIAICTLLCAVETFNDMEDFGKAKHHWFKTFFGRPALPIAGRRLFWPADDRLGATDHGPLIGPRPEALLCWRTRGTVRGYFATGK